jgi:transposase-like protein
MSETMLAALTNIRTAEDMIVAFRDEEQCRRLLESMVWPAGRVCPSCGCKRSIAIAGRDLGKRRARPGLYQCSNGDCRFQFTVTTHTPLHSTKLPLSVWLKRMWLMLQSDKGLSSVRLLGSHPQTDGRALGRECRYGPNDGRAPRRRRDPARSTLRKTLPCSWSRRRAGNKVGTDAGSWLKDS